MEGTPRQFDQFETLSALRLYAAEVIRLTTSDEGGVDLRPSTAKMVIQAVSRMHNIKDRLTV